MIRVQASFENDHTLAQMHLVHANTASSVRRPTETLQGTRQIGVDAWLTLQFRHAPLVTRYFRQ